MTMRSFSDLGVSAPVVDALARRGIHAPFEIQARVLPDAMARRDAHGKARTGSGNVARWP